MYACVCEHMNLSTCLGYCFSGPVWLSVAIFELPCINFFESNVGERFVITIIWRFGTIADIGFPLNLSLGSQ